MKRVENTLKFDGFRSNNKERANNIAKLRKLGFNDCSAYSTSGMIYMEVLDNRKVKIVFGVSCNIGSKNFNKYFSLVKYYNNKKDADKEYKKLLKQLVFKK